MRTFLLLIGVTLLSVTANAATINLSDGDEMVIYANSETTVSCNAKGTSTTTISCTDRVDTLEGLLQSCYKGASMSYCVTNIWPDWKSNNPSCVSEGSLACVNYCYKGASMSYCVSNCK